MDLLLARALFLAGNYLFADDVDVSELLLVLLFRVSSSLVRTFLIDFMVRVEIVLQEPSYHEQCRHNYMSVLQTAHDLVEALTTLISDPTHVVRILAHVNNADELEEMRHLVKHEQPARSQNRIEPHFSCLN